jgi:hypothetical protein
VPDALSGNLASTIDVVSAVIKGTAASLTSGITGGRAVETGSSAAIEWVFGRILKREWRIDCLDVAIRL